MAETAPPPAEEAPSPAVDSAQAPAPAMAPPSAPDELPETPGPAPAAVEPAELTGAQAEPEAVAVQGVTSDEEKKRLLAMRDEVRRQQQGVVTVANKTSVEADPKEKQAGWTAWLLKLFATVPAEIEQFPRPRAHYIAVPQAQLVEALLNHWTEKKGGEEGARLGQLCKSISSYYHVTFRQTAESLLNLFSYFDPKKPISRIEKERLLGAEIELREDEFLDLLTEVLDRGNYRLMTETEMGQALKLNYNLSVEIDLDADAVDGRLFFRHFQRLKKNPPAQGSQDLRYRADITDFILLFHRGTGIEAKTDLFVMEKINLLLTRAQTVFLDAVAYVKKRLGLGAKSKAPKDDGVASSGSVAFPKSTKTLVTVGMWTALYLYAAYQQLAHPPPGAGAWDYAGWVVVELLLATTLVYVFLYSPRRRPAMETEVEKERTERAKIRKVFPEKVAEADVKIDRVRIDQLRLLPQDIVVEHTIQEPSFKDMVLVYRPAGSKHIMLKHFHDIPRADLELLFPARIIKLPSMDSVMLLVTIAMGLATVVTTALDAGQFSDELVLTIVGGLGYMGYRAYSQRALAMQTQEATLTETLYTKMLSNNDSLILKLVHSCEDQEVCEAVLGYYMLLLHGPLELEELDRLAEAFLLEKLGLDVDFEVEDSISKLLALGLAGQQETSSKYACVAVDTATAILQEKWAAMDIGMKQRKAKMQPLDAVGAVGGVVGKGVVGVGKGVVGVGKGVATVGVGVAKGVGGVGKTLVKGAANLNPFKSKPADK